jgi:hypothetical protein
LLTLAATAALTVPALAGAASPIGQFYRQFNKSRDGPVTLEYWEDKQTGVKRALCAWAIVVALVAGFQIADLVWRGSLELYPTRITDIQP